MITRILFAAFVISGGAFCVAMVFMPVSAVKFFATLTVMTCIAMVVSCIWVGA